MSDNPSEGAMQPVWTTEKRGQEPSPVPPLDMYGPQMDEERLKEAWGKYLGRIMVISGVLALVLVSFFVHRAFSFHKTMLLNVESPNKDPFEGLVHISIQEKKQLPHLKKWFIKREPKQGRVFRAVKVKVTYRGSDTYFFNPHTVRLFTENTRYFLDLDWRRLDQALPKKKMKKDQVLEGWLLYSCPTKEKPLGLHLDGTIGALATAHW